MNDAAILRAVEAQGTPFYLYDLAVIRRQLRDLKAALGSRFEVALSLKANPNPNLLRLIHDECDLIDVASHGEMLLARMAGVEPQRLLFVGPGKCPDELNYAIDQGIGCIVAESFEEAYDISARSLARGKTTALALRINPGRRYASVGMEMGGVASQFGVDEAVALERIDELARLPAIAFLGIHVYAAAQVLDADCLGAGIAYILDLAIRLQERAGVTFRMVDVGGGFGVNYFEGERSLDLDQLSLRLRELLESESVRRGLDVRTRLVVETGRFVFANCGVYCASVLYRKESQGRKFCILDGGSNFNGSLSGMGRFLRKNFPFRVIRRDGVGPSPAEPGGETPYTIVGPLCLPRDQLALNAAGPVPAVGDVVVFEKSGAYGLTFSQTGFLSHLSIQELGLDDERIVPLKKRKTEELLIHEFAVD